ncbi:MAG: hypothetical protein ACYS30_22010 [Planctomycetota bacterium]|jgi:hypothetical protein
MARRKVGCEVMGPVVVSVRIYPSRQGGKVVGHYIKVSGLFVAGKPDLCRIQLVGVHDFLCVTIVRPKQIDSLFGVASDLKETRKWGPVTWVGGVKCYPTTSGFKIYLPKRLWMHDEDSAFNTCFCTTGLVTWERSIHWPRDGYVILTVPVLNREVLANKVHYDKSFVK